MRIYFDNNATTPMHPSAVETLTTLSAEVFGNPSSVHFEGRKAKQVLEDARDRVAALLGAESKDIVFTSGGTESNNAALRGVVSNGSECCHIVTTTIEHPSVAAVVADLEVQGHEVTRIKPQASGRVDADEVIAALRPGTRLVTMMLANNETGVIQPVKEVAEVCRARGILFHTDAVQAIGKTPVSVADLGVDVLALAGHKFHGPKGAGALWVRGGSGLAGWVIGGSQERRRRAGTEAVPLYAALGAAALAVLDEQDLVLGMESMRDRLEEAILGAIDGSVVNGKDAARVPNTTNLRISGCDSESMVIGLDLEGISVSGGAACGSGRVEGSHVLREMGVSLEDARSSFRISICRFTKKDEIDQFVGAVVRVAASVRASTGAAVTA